MSDIYIGETHNFLLYKFKLTPSDRPDINKETHPGVEFKWSLHNYTYYGGSKVADSILRDHGNDQVNMMAHVIVPYRISKLYTN